MDVSFHHLEPLLPYCYLVHPQSWLHFQILHQLDLRDELVALWSSHVIFLMFSLLTVNIGVEPSHPTYPTTSELRSNCSASGLAWISIASHWYRHWYPSNDAVILHILAWSIYWQGWSRRLSAAARMPSNVLNGSNPQHVTSHHQHHLEPWWKLAENSIHHACLITTESSHANTIP